METEYILARVGNVAVGGTGITGPVTFQKAGQMRLKKVTIIPMYGTVAGANIGTVCIRLKPGPNVVSGTNILVKMPTGLNVASLATLNHTEVLWLDLSGFYSDGTNSWDTDYKEWINPSRKWHNVKQSDILIVETQAQFGAFQCVLLIEMETRYGS